MQLVLIPKAATATLHLPAEDRLSDQEYWDFCVANPDLRIERTTEREINIVPPAGPESSYRSLEVAAQLRDWAVPDRRGKAFDSSVQFLLPDGAAFSPDASWVSNESLSRFSRQERKRFLRLSPEFVVEVISPSDRLKSAKEKMERWIANGVQLAWLIDGDAQTVYIYRQGHAVRKRRGAHEITGDAPVQGFVLKLDAIWKGL